MVVISAESDNHRREKNTYNNLSFEIQNTVRISRSLRNNYIALHPFLAFKYKPYLL